LKFSKRFNFGITYKNFIFISSYFSVVSSSCSSSLSSQTDQILLKEMIKKNDLSELSSRIVSSIFLSSFNREFKMVFLEKLKLKMEIKWHL